MAMKSDVTEEETRWYGISIKYTIILFINFST